MLRMTDADVDAMNRRLEQEALQKELRAVEKYRRANRGRSYEQTDNITGMKYYAPVNLHRVSDPESAWNATWPVDLSHRRED